MPDSTANTASEYCVPRTPDIGGTGGDRRLCENIETTFDRVESALNRLIQEDQPTYATSVIVPAFNERATLPEVIRRIRDAFPINTQLIIVDDASTDGTTEWLRSLERSDECLIIRRRRNHGKGSAVRLGIRHSRGEVVAIQDADLEYEPADLIPLIETVRSRGADVVYGSRYLEDSDDGSVFHRLGNQALTWMSNCMAGSRLTDMETCHKVFRGDLIRSIAIRECRFGFEPEITSKISRSGVTIIEQPTGYRYRSYDDGKKITWRDGVAAIGCMWRYRNPGWMLRLGKSMARTTTAPLRYAKRRAGSTS